MNNDSHYVISILISAYIWTEPDLGCIVGNNDWVGITRTLSDCQRKCEIERDFICLSIEFRDGSCHLSRYSQKTIQPITYFMQPCNSNGWYYSERINIGQWTGAVSHCIALTTTSSITVPDLNSCRLMCSQEDGCCSVDYFKGQCNLMNKKRENLRPSSDRTEPCYVTGWWQYSERVGEYC